MSKVYLCQLDIAWENKPLNHEMVRQMLSTQDVQPGSLIVLPETFSTGYSMQVDQVQDDATNASAQFMSELAKSYACWVVGGLVRKAPSGRGYNQAVVINPAGQETNWYNKLHLMGIYDETNKYDPGDQLVTFEWGGFKVAPIVCYDLRFPELFRRHAINGVDLFVVIANWPVARKAHWRLLLTARAVENQAYVVGVNRTGTDPKLTFEGESMVIDPMGNILVETDKEAGVVSADLDPEEVDRWRTIFPALQDARKDLLSD